MSSNILRLIPTDSTFVPANARWAGARALVESLVSRADSIKVHVYDAPAFVDPGENLDSVGCPSCGHVLDSQWWQEAMGTAAESDFMDLSIETPCCSSSTSLNDLKYDMPAGFARFVIEADGPVNSEFLGPEAIARLETALGTAVRQVLARY